jgi:hypothetical protein
LIITLVSSNFSELGNGFNFGIIYNNIHNIYLQQ